MSCIIYRCSQFGGVFIEWYLYILISDVFAPTVVKIKNPILYDTIEESTMFIGPATNTNTRRICRDIVCVCVCVVH